VTKNELKDKWFEVTILNYGREGYTRCYQLYNDLLGEIEIGNCLYNTDPQYFPGAMNCLNGSCLLSLEDGECNFFVVLTINSDDSTKGVVLFRC
jgi:hypothetical protein